MEEVARPRVWLRGLVVAQGAGRALLGLVEAATPDEAFLVRGCGGMNVYILVL